MNAMPPLVVATLVLGALGCGPGLLRSGSSDERVADALVAYRRDGATVAHRDHVRTLLTHSVARDAYGCLPPPALVLSAPQSGWPERRFASSLPHYDWYHGPVRYRIGVAEGAAPEWLVRVNVAVEISFGGTLELPDCALKPTLGDALHCEGTPYEDAPGTEVCPGSGRFEAPADRQSVGALLAHWSEAVEAYYNRDASHYGLPVRYDFSFFAADGGVVPPVDVRLPLRKTCGRTPYFASIRSGWSVPIVAHEMAHFLGLSDEYEPLSGIASFYPKAPFEGSAGSRMGLSMKPDTRLWPLHHYLVLRRYHCAEPATLDPYRSVLDANTP